MTITEQISNAFGEPDNHELSEDTTIQGEVFLEGTYLIEVLEKFGYKDRSVNFLVRKSTDGSVDLFDIHECPDDSFFVIYEDTQNVIWYLGSIYWDFTDEDGLLIGGDYEPMGYFDLFEHCKNQKELDHVIDMLPKDYVLPASFLVFGGE
tara:strand:- start:444 stop:893 length:450 start_codon:yes stop_codon:yes gene_type:complete